MKPKTTMSAESFAQIRKSHGLSVRSFADEIGISKNSVTAYELGRAPVPKVVARSLMLLDLLRRTKG